MKTGGTSAGSAAQQSQGRGGWSWLLISCFHWSLLLPKAEEERWRSPVNAHRGVTLETERTEPRESIILSKTKRRKRACAPRILSPWASAAAQRNSSDCRFKCLLITRLVPQPPRSLLALHFYKYTSGETERTYFQESTFHIHPGASFENSPVLASTRLGPLCSCNFSRDLFSIK